MSACFIYNLRILVQYLLNPLHGKLGRFCIHPADDHLQFIQSSVCVLHQIILRKSKKVSIFVILTNNQKYNKIGNEFTIDRYIINKNEYQ